MRLAYYVPAQLHAHPGIGARVEMTMRAWERLGTPATLVTGPTIESGGGSAWSGVAHLRSDRSAAAQVSDLVREGSITHVHQRLFLPTSGWLRMQVPASIEVHARLRRAESRRDITRVIAGWRVSRRLRNRCGAGVFITEELSEQPEYRTLPFRVTLGNGTELSHPVSAPANRVPVIGLSVGSASAWHGVDRFERLAAVLPDVRFRLLHPERVSMPAPDHGRLEVIRVRSRSHFRSELAQLDAAMGSLAMERAGLTEAAPLKVRDYVDAGIPTVLPYVDTNLDGCSDPMLLRLSRNSSGWATALMSWLSDVSGQRLRESTRQAVSIDVIEARRLEMLASCT